jgi:3-hydroxyisobutyrate dehydrogenase
MGSVLAGNLVESGHHVMTMIEVIDASSGQSAAARDKFPNHVPTGRYAAGLANTLMSKDLKLYVGAVEAQMRRRCWAA